MGLFVWIGLAAGTIWVVDQSGAGDATTIEEGAALLSEGDTLEIRAGDYEENFVAILHADVEIKGAGWESTIIYEKPRADGQSFGIVGGEGITISGLSFVGFEDTAFTLDTSEAEVLVRDCAFVDNYYAIFGDGAHVSRVRVEDSFFFTNDFAIGSVELPAEVDVTNSVFVDTIVKSTWHAYPDSGISQRYEHNTFVHSFAGFGNYSYAHEGATVLFAGNVFVADAAPLYVAEGWYATFADNVYSTPTALADWSIGPTSLIWTNNVEADPQFVAWSDDDDWTNDDFHLLPGSPAIDLATSGYSTATTDIEGYSRPEDGDGDGAAYSDAGAYEYSDDRDDDGYSSLASGGEDCDDADAGISPGATESYYDGIDADCSGDGDYDADADGFDSSAYGGEDCDDADAGISPSATESYYDGIDADCSGDGDYDADADGHDSDLHGGEDCDDADSAVSPDSTETYYDGIDEDCSGTSDYDADRDGFQSADYGGVDCDDADAAISPGASETYYDGIDADCSGDGDYDADADGYDSSAYGGDDCNDADAAISPRAIETYYDGIDADCSGTSDFDADADGYDSSAYGGDDCNDADAAISPRAIETYYDGIDGDCSGTSDFDADADGYDSSAYGGDDCNDADAAISPRAIETYYDGIDGDCSGDGDFDADADGYDSSAYGGDDCNDANAAVNPGATDSFYDGIDRDCDGGSEYDADGDSFDSIHYGGTDCDDADPAVHPAAAADVCGDGIDSDCDGEDPACDDTAGDTGNATQDTDSVKVEEDSGVSPADPPECGCGGPAGAGLAFALLPALVVLRRARRSG